MKGNALVNDALNTFHLRIFFCIFVRIAKPDIHSIYKYGHTCIRTYIHTYIVYTYIHTRIYTYIYTYMHIYIQRYIYTFIPTYLHTYLGGRMVSVAGGNYGRIEGRKEMFYLTMQSTHFIYGYMASDIWLRTILIVRKETRFRQIDYSLRLTARVRLYAPSHRQDSSYHGLCYTSRGALAGTRNSSMGSPYEGSIR